MKNSDQPINAMPYQNQDGSIQHDVYFGLTKREYFAAMAMQGLLSADKDFMMKIEDTVRCAVSHADALLKELETKTEQ